MGTCGSRGVDVVQGVIVEKMEEGGVGKEREETAWRGKHQILKVERGATPIAVLKTGKGVRVRARRLEGSTMDVLVYLPEEAYLSLSDVMKTALDWKSEGEYVLLIRSEEEVEEICKELLPSYPDFEEMKEAMKGILT